MVEEPASLISLRRVICSSVLDCGLALLRCCGLRNVATTRENSAPEKRPQPRGGDIRMRNQLPTDRGGERTVIMVSATESDRAYLLASSTFLLDPRCLTVALSRPKRKLILVASRSSFSLFSTDEETFTNSLLWTNLLLRTCSTLLCEGERAESGWRYGAGRARL